MKKILLIAFAGLFIGFANPGYAQCTFGSVGVKINSSTTVGTTCVINLDLYFDIDHNPGGKYFWIHIWPTSLYPGYNYVDPPTTSQVPNANSALNNSITTFGFFHQGGLLIPQLSYNPDPNAPGFQFNYTITEVAGSPDRYTVHGIVLTLPLACNIAQQLTADLWESQSANAQNVHCFSVNQPFYVNDPTIVGGLLFCQLPRTYKFDITTLSATSKTVNYKVVIDNGDGVYNSGTDIIEINSGVATISNSSPFHSGILGYLPYSNQKPEADRALWIIVLKNGTDLPNDIYARLENLCAPLPVSFGSFSAARRNREVDLLWTTASEQNNKGFLVERKTEGGDWVMMAFVPSAALNGNSSVELSYSYVDPNSLSTVSQYRLVQVDLDNRFAYSETRLVKGLNQKAGILVYPNPSWNGQINIVMDIQMEETNIKLVDMYGRVIREWQNFSESRLTLSNIPSGVYLLKATMKTSGQESVVKVIVNR